jgi:hypothetical protein
MSVVTGTRVVDCDRFDKPSTCRNVWERRTSMPSKQTHGRRNLGRLFKTEREAACQPAMPIGEGEE